MCCCDRILIVDTPKNLQVAEEQLADDISVELVTESDFNVAFDRIKGEYFTVVISELFPQEREAGNFPTMGEQLCAFAVDEGCHQTAVFSLNTPERGWFRLNPSLDWSTPFQDFTGEACLLREDGSKDWKAIIEKLN